MKDRVVSWGLGCNYKMDRKIIIFLSLENFQPAMDQLETRKQKNHETQNLAVLNVYAIFKACEKWNSLIALFCRLNLAICYYGPAFI